MADDNTLVHVLNGQDYETVSIMDLAGIDLDSVPEYRGGEAAPEGMVDWRGISAMFAEAEMEDKDKKSPTFGDKVMRAVVDFNIEAIAYQNVKDRSIDITTLAGTTHRERFFIRDLAKDMGRVKAFMIDCGMTGKGTYADLFEQFIGYEFSGAIKHTKNKDDTSKVYANLDMKTLCAIGGAGEPIGGGLSLKLAS